MRGKQAPARRYSGEFCSSGGPGDRTHSATLLLRRRAALSYAGIATVLYGTLLVGVRDGLVAPQGLADVAQLLWAAQGITSPDGKRTAPTSRNRQELSIYVLEARGVSVYDAAAHRLVPVVAEDLRAVQSAQEFVRDAPVTFVYVADLSKLTEGTVAEKEATAAIDTGFVSQNVYLWCASEGLATGVRTWVDRDVLSKRMKLRPDERIVAAQSIGFPKK